MCYDSAPEWTWEWWQWRGTPHSSKLQHYWSLTVRLYQGHSLWRFYPFVEMQSVDSAVPADWDDDRDETINHMRFCPALLADIEHFLIFVNSLVSLFYRISTHVSYFMPNTVYVCIYVYVYIYIYINLGWNVIESKRAQSVLLFTDSRRGKS